MKYRILITFLLFLTSVLYPQEELNTNGEVLGSWKISNGILIGGKDVNTNLARANWKVFYDLFPKKITRKYIKKLVLVSDGEDEKTGALGALNNSNSEWQLVIDPADVDFTSDNPERRYQSLYTFIHEFGHLLTLNTTQIRPSIKKEQKPFEPYITMEGEANKNSYINMFVVEFWNGRLLEEWDDIQKKYCYTEQKSCIEKLYGLYQDNHSDFVTDYAAESPEEDIVESWTAFILGGKVDNPLTISDRKVNFFYQFQELVYYRTLIRKKMFKYL